VAGVKTAPRTNGKLRRSLNSVEDLSLLFKLPYHYMVLIRYCADGAIVVEEIHIC